MSSTIWLENTRWSFGGARRKRSRSPGRAIRSIRLSWEAIEDRIALSGFTQFVDPDPAPGNDFGATVVPLSTGNVVVTSPDDNAGGEGAGAVYLFDGATGALVSTLTGSHADDNIGSGGVTALSDGNFVVSSPDWTNGAGAVTWGSGTTGVSGTVSATNSLVGSTTNDSVGGSGGVTALTNGNYVVSSPNWTNGTAAGAGAVTWGSATTGVSGAVGATNSLVGSTANDFVGGGGVTALSNGNYVVSTPTWTNGAATAAGAVTWGSGTAGISGAVSATNSLVGSTENDSVGTGDVTALSDGNYVVSSPGWSNGAATGAGAVTWGSGAAGVNGPISATNSLVGSSANDSVGGVNAVGWGLFGSVTALSDGNYVVSSPSWSNGAATDAGAVTWGSGTAGVSGAVSATNSLVGSRADDQVGGSGSGNYGGNSGGGVTALSDGNYVVSSPGWSNGAATDSGAVTWGSGAAGVSGPISATNSLVGSSANDSVGGGDGAGGVTALSNGNYVVTSPDWTNGAAAGAGAVTWGSGTAGVSGPVNAMNSLVGGTANDSVGGGNGTGVTALSNGNYVVSSPGWNNDAGAVTWGSGTAGVGGAVSTTNSLVGSTAGDSVGENVGNVTALSNGNYVVTSQYWNNGAGAVTWGSGTAGVSGTISAANSLVGSGTASEEVGSGGVTELSNGNYVVSSPGWTNGAATDVGAVTWGSGAAGVSGPISATNSLVGSTVNDSVGTGGVTALSDGNYVVSSPGWSNGAAASAGAVTWGSGTAGVSGAVSAANSLVGSSANDSVGGVTALSDGNYVVTSPDWTNGAAASAGAVTWSSGTAGVSGAISIMNSAIGAVANGGLAGAVSDDVNGTFYGAFVTDGAGRVSVGSQATGFGAKGFAGPGFGTAQTITFGPLPDRTYGDAPFTVSASASSLLPVSYSIVDGAAYASVTGNTVHILAATPAGTVVTVEADQAGNGTYASALPVDQSFTINQPTHTPTPTPTPTPTNTPTPTPPQVLAIAGVSSQKGLISFTVSFNEPLSSSSAMSSGLYQVFAAVTKIEKKHKETRFNKALAIRSVSPDSTGSTVTVNLAKPFKGKVEVMVQGNITAGNGASDTVRFTQNVLLSMHRGRGRAPRV
jgi:hypothetical protein